MGREDSKRNECNLFFQNGRQGKKKKKILRAQPDSELDFLHLAPESSVALGNLHKIGI